mmetsp:Transcript_85690/g.179035  ORF Transcript_85690/g.179035 Transcript_85690/m.179035 type:complete len:206 (-) Transcript_85690:2468-3085(-)
MILPNLILHPRPGNVVLGPISQDSKRCPSLWSGCCLCLFSFQLYSLTCQNFLLQAESLHQTRHLLDDRCAVIFRLATNQDLRGCRCRLRQIGVWQPGRPSCIGPYQNAVHLLLEILDVHSLQAIELLGWKLDFRDGLVVDVGACLTMPRRSASVKQLPYPGEAALIRGFQSQTCRICASQLKGFEAVFEAALHVFDSSDAVDVHV